MLNNNSLLSLLIFLITQSISNASPAVIAYNPAVGGSYDTVVPNAGVVYPQNYEPSVIGTSQAPPPVVVQPVPPPQPAPQQSIAYGTVDAGIVNTVPFSQHIGEQHQSMKKYSGDNHLQSDMAVLQAELKGGDKESKNHLKSNTNHPTYKHQFSFRECRNCEIH